MPYYIHFVTIVTNTCDGCRVCLGIFACGPWHTTDWYRERLWGTIVLEANPITGQLGLRHLKVYKEEYIDPNELWEVYWIDHTVRPFRASRHGPWLPMTHEAWFE